MAPPAAPGPRCPLLPFLLLLLPGAARGNEGGAAGSCQCRRVRAAPRFLDKLKSCDTCKDFTRFNFPNRSVCGLKEEEWVLQLRDSHCQKGGRPEKGAGGAEAGGGHHLPAPTPPSTGPPPTSPSTVAAGRGESLEGAGESHPEEPWAPATGRSTPEEPSLEAAVGEANLAPWEEEEAAPSAAPQDARTPSVAVLCAAVVAGCGAILAYCRRRRWHRRRQAGQRGRAPLGGKEEGTLCLPGEHS